MAIEATALDATSPPQVVGERMAARARAVSLLVCVARVWMVGARCQSRDAVGYVGPRTGGAIQQGSCRTGLARGLPPGGAGFHRAADHVLHGRAKITARHRDERAMAISSSATARSVMS